MRLLVSVVGANLSMDLLEQIKGGDMNSFLSINKNYLNTGLKSIDILILAQIEEYQRNGCECYVTNQQFADMFGESISTIKRSIDKLEEKGMLERKTHSRTDNGQKSKERTLKVTKVHYDPNFNNKQGSNIKKARFKNEESKVHNEPIKEKKKDNKKDNNIDFNKVLSALSNKGIDATIDDVIKGYNFSKNIKHKSWTIDEMVDFINKENKSGFYEYVNDF